MRVTIIHIILSFVLCCQLNVTHAQYRSENALHELDVVISDKAIYHKQLEQKLSEIKGQIATTNTLDVKYDLYQDLYSDYLHFQADSALHYVNVRARLIKESDDADRLNMVYINRAEVYGVMGMYFEAQQELKRVCVEQLDLSTKGCYYRTYRAYYGWLADYTAVESAKDKYLERAELYRDSVLMYEQVADNRSMIYVEQLINQNKLDMAIEELNILSALTKDSKQQAYIHYNLAQAYLKKDDVESAIYYLAQTAIFDIRMGTREYASLQYLAYVLYQQGQVDRAFDYLSCSMEDAVASNARLRFMEVTKYYPIVDRAYRSIDVMHRNTTYKLLMFVSAFAILLIIFIIYLIISRMRLSDMRANLHDTNESLVTLNNRLMETGRIKEVYIARYLERCVNYIDKLDTYRRSLKRLASASKTEELLKVLKSEQMLQRERKEFYVEFDRSFLTLFPNFVSDFNDLLKECEQISLKSEGQLNTELRIFALIRLGITDATQISRFLGYSLSTVYSYRSKMRNRAVVDKDLFEQRVMEL